MSSAPGSPNEMALMLADDIEGVAEALGISVAHRDRRKLYCFSPWNAHHKPKLEIEVYPLAGKWNDWIEGKFGDALGLVACVLTRTCDPKNRAAIGEAMKWARDYFGLAATSDIDKASWAKRRAEAEARAAAARAKAARELGESRKTAQGLWLHARPLEKGDAGWAYLAARGIDLDLFSRRPRAVRLSPEQPWRDVRTGDVAHVGPALMSAMTLHGGAFGSLHRTWIDPSRPGEKADIDPARKMWPASEGAAIRLWRGDSGLSEGDADKAGLIEDTVLCEGVEDGLSIALMTPEYRIHAVGSLGGLLSYHPGRSVRRLIIAADNDWGKPQAQASLDRACERLAREFGKSISIARSPVGKDFNDLLRG